MMGCQRYQLDQMHIICTSLQTDNHASTASIGSFTRQMLFLVAHKQCQSTERIVLLSTKQRR